MTEEQAKEVVMLVQAAAAHPVDLLTIEYFEARLLGLEYQEALSAATLGANTWKRFPSWAIFTEMYRTQRRGAEAAPPTAVPARFNAREIPRWVRRWIASRFLFSRFGRDRDLRPLREQEPVVGPVEEFMPDGEWEEEAIKVSDKDVWGSLGA